MKTRKLLIALLAMFALIAAACGDDDDGAVASSGGDDSEAPEGPAIKIGAQDFGESAILAEIYGQVLEANGYEVEQVSVGGFRDVLLGAFDSGDVNMSAEYAASMLEFLNGNAGAATGDATETVELLQAQLDEIGLVATEPAPAVDTNAFVITQETADAEGFPPPRAAPTPPRRAGAAAARRRWSAPAARITARRRRSGRFPRVPASSSPGTPPGAPELILNRNST